MKTAFLISALSLLVLAAGGILIFGSEKEEAGENGISGVSVRRVSNKERLENGGGGETEERVREILDYSERNFSDIKDSGTEEEEKSANVKGAYFGGAYNFQHIKDVLRETELNCAVIDIKEAYGINLRSSFKRLIDDLHREGAWVIARIVVFRDSSLVEGFPQWYLEDSNSTSSENLIWRDSTGIPWLDPSDSEVRSYIEGLSKKAIDYGFDELQFDYIRYPENYESKKDKCEVIGGFFKELTSSLKDYKSSIVLSVDLFGYVALQHNSYEIGQRTEDAAKNFDYLSYMIYPSHFYGGFTAGGIQYMYPEVSEHPYEVVYHSVSSASEYISSLGERPSIRPWLQDFDLTVDVSRKVIYGEEKIRDQIRAARDAGASGWLLWNPAGDYTLEALK